MPISKEAVGVGVLPEKAPLAWSLPKGNDIWWSVLGLLTFFPMTALLHHGLFRPHQCMTNLLGRNAVLGWIKSDPSAWLAFAGAVTAAVMGSRHAKLRPWVLSFLISFLPFSLWIWDIPGSGGVICPLFHDGRGPFRSWHLYLFGALAFVPFAYLLMGRARAANRGTRVPAPAGVRLPSRRPGATWPQMPGTIGDGSPRQSPPSV